MSKEVDDNKGVDVVVFSVCRRKSESGAEAEDSADTDAGAGDISVRTRSAVQRQKKTTTKPFKDDKDKKNALTCSPGKFKKVMSKDEYLFTMKFSYARFLMAFGWLLFLFSVL